jgi:hypothetical protein
VQPTHLKQSVTVLPQFLECLRFPKLVWQSMSDILATWMPLLIWRTRAGKTDHTIKLSEGMLVSLPAKISCSLCSSCSALLAQARSQVMLELNELSYFGSCMLQMSIVALQNGSDWIFVRCTRGVTGQSVLDSLQAPPIFSLE